MNGIVQTVFADRFTASISVRRRIGLGVLLSVLLFGGTAGANPQARSAQSMTVADEGHLHLIRSSGSLLIDEGSATGTIPGKVKVSFVYNGNPTVSAQITIYGHTGIVKAHASGRLSSPTSPNPSFKGSLTIEGGTGHYLHARGSGQLYGVFYRRTYAMLVQTRGALHF